MRVIIACGGSGGHIIPGLSLAAALREKRKDIEIFFAASRKPIDRKLLRHEKKVFYLPVSGMPDAVSWRIVPFLVKLSLSLILCFWKMVWIRPDVLVGFGGYVSGPVIFAGALSGKPTLIHEENLIPGRANRWLSCWASQVGVAFEETKNRFPGRAPVLVVGNPLRRDLAALSAQDARAYFGLNQGDFTVLVLGGSQGAHSVNQLVTEAFTRMGQEARGTFQVIHLAGAKDAKELERLYQQLGIRACVYDFLDAMGQAYSAADLVVGRGGAMTLAEIGHFQKAAIFIPLALAGSHQMENVKYLAECGACLVFDEKEKEAEAFARELLALKKDEARRKTLSEKLASFHVTDGAARLAEAVFALSGAVPRRDSR
ncbi:MAG: undecaprenyldiphospho-muramoylpentapeptide beta-N-acetylglucosaminyltransferase [Candidatus Omnitrophota bacterium]